MMLSSMRTFTLAPLNRIGPPQAEETPRTIEKLLFTFQTNGPVPGVQKMVTCIIRQVVGNP
jgi:hypothetical protein